MEPEKVYQILKEELSKHRSIVFAYVFGSFVKYSEYAKDIDIAVFVSGKIRRNFERELSLLLSRKLGKEVEVFVLNDKPLLFLSEVFRNCKLVFSRDERKRIAFESFVLPEIQDFNELIRIYNEARCKRYGIR